MDVNTLALKDILIYEAYDTSTLLSKKRAFSTEEAQHGSRIHPSHLARPNSIDASSFSRKCKKPEAYMEPIQKDAISVLKTSTIKKMLERLLTEKHLPKHELAATLAVTMEELDDLLTQSVVCSEIALKISLPLTKLYCKTKWA